MNDTVAQEITGRITQDNRGAVLEGVLVPTAKSPVRRVLDAFRAFYRAELRHASSSVVSDLAQRAETEAAISGGIETKLVGFAHRVIVEIAKIRERTGSRKAGADVLSIYLGEYSQETGTFSGGLEGTAEELLQENEAVLALVEEADETGYQEFGKVMRRLDVLTPQIEAADTAFRNLNRTEGQGKSWIDLRKLKSKEQRTKWLAKTFGLNKSRVEQLWQEAEQAFMSDIDPEEKQKHLKNLVSRWNHQGVSRSEQMSILGIIQLTRSQGIENFLQDETIVNEDGQEVQAVSLTGDKLHKLQAQYTEMVSLFLTSISRNGDHLRYDNERGILVAQIHYHDRARLRYALDFLTGQQTNMVVENAPADARIHNIDLLQFLVERGRPESSTSTNNLWHKFVAIAKLETAYFDRFRGEVNTAERFTQARHDRAAFDEVASAEVIRNEWFGRIPGFKEAVAKYTNGDGEFDRLLKDAGEGTNKTRERELQDAERYARYFLEMLAVSIGGLNKDAHHTFMQVFDATLSSRSGPLAERVGEDVSCPIKRKTISDAVENKNYKWRARVESGNDHQSAVINIDGLAGEIVIDRIDADLVTLLSSGDMSLTDYLITNGQYRENGYWAAWGDVVGAGFNAHMKDGVEHSFGRLCRGNLAMYQAREIWRRLNEAYNGSEEHKRIFIQFLLEKRQALGGQNWKQTFQEENGVSFDPYNNGHINLLAGRLKITGATLTETVNKLADPEQWGLYFDPTDQTQVDHILTDKKNLGMDRFFLNILWAFEAVSDLRENTNTLVEMGIHGVHYENGIWTGLTVEKLEKLIGKWKHIGDNPTAAFEVLARLEDTLNRAQTEELMIEMRRRDRKTNHQILGQLFDHDLWKRAVLTRDERDAVLRGEKIRGEIIPELTEEELRMGVTKFGKASEIVARRERFNLRISLDQMLFWELVSQPGLGLNVIFQKFFSESMFSEVQVLFDKGTQDRIAEDPSLFSRLDLKDWRNFRIVTATDPRAKEMRQRVTAALFKSSSLAQANQMYLAVLNGRSLKPIWNTISQLSNQGLWMDKVIKLWGIDNLYDLKLQFDDIYSALADAAHPRSRAWEIIDGEYVNLPEPIVRFAREYYGINIRSAEVVRQQGADFLDNLREIIADRERFMFAMYGLRMAGGQIPSQYEVFLKQTLSAARKDRNKNGWFRPTKEIEVVLETGERKIISITHAMAIEKISGKRNADPCLCDWPDVPVPWFQRDNVTYQNACFINPELPIGFQFSRVVSMFEGLRGYTASSGIDGLSENTRTLLIPQLERFVLTQDRVQTIGGESILIDANNITQYLPQILENFSSKLSIDFYIQYIMSMYGVDSRSTTGWKDVATYKKALRLAFDSMGAEKLNGLMRENATKIIENPSGYGLSDQQAYGAYYYLVDTAGKMYSSIEGLSEIGKLISLSQDRQFLYAVMMAIEDRTTELGLSDEEAMQQYVAYQAMAETETVELTEHIGEQRYMAARQQLERLGITDPVDIAVFMGGLKANKGNQLEILKSVLFSSAPWELNAALGDNETVIERFGSIANAIGLIKDAQVNAAWNILTYHPAPFNISWLANKLGFGEMARIFAKSPLGLKVGGIPFAIASLAVTAPTMAIVGQILSHGVQAFVSWQGLATIMSNLNLEAAFTALTDPTQLFFFVVANYFSASLVGAPLHYAWNAVLESTVNKGKRRATISMYFAKKVKSL
jgi:hypothetical protein